MNATCTHTRISVAGQIRLALDDMVARGAMQAWSFSGGHEGRYTLTVVDGFAGLMKTGECMDFLNATGYDIRFGKVPA